MVWLVFYLFDILPSKCTFVQKFKPHVWIVYTWKITLNIHCRCVIFRIHSVSLDQIYIDGKSCISAELCNKLHILAHIRTLSVYTSIHKLCYKRYFRCVHLFSNLNFFFNSFLSALLNTTRILTRYARLQILAYKSYWNCFLIKLQISIGYKQF